MTTQADKPETGHHWIWSQIRERYGEDVVRELRPFWHPPSRLWAELARRYGADVANELKTGWKRAITRYTRWKNRLGTPFGIDEPIPNGWRRQQWEQQRSAHDRLIAQQEALVGILTWEAFDSLRDWLRDMTRHCRVNPDGSWTISPVFATELRELLYSPYKNQHPAELAPFRKQAKETLRLFLRYGWTPPQPDQQAQLDHANAELQRLLDAWAAKDQEQQEQPE